MLPVIYLWKKIPFLRLLFPLIAGILLQWHCPIELFIWHSILLFFSVILSIFFLLPLFHKFRSSWITGLCITVIFISVGAILTWHNTIKNDPSWFGFNLKQESTLIVSLAENPIEKTKSLKAIAHVLFLKNDTKSYSVKGKMIIYFKKDSLSLVLKYGSVIAFRKPLQEIKNSGNPGGFDYKRYCLFGGITHQLYLKSDEMVILPQKNETALGNFLLTIQAKVLQIIRTNITSAKEAGLAEALLIGYKNDLDKTLVQSYSNTGVVHIIAISGLHLGIIYWLLTLALNPLKKRKQFRFLYALLIISSLWIFSLLAGGQPSITRAAVMFTCIAIGDSLSRKTNIYNTLAISAFLLLLYNPYWLWDVGFQLSYAAVLSIILFVQPIYHWFYFKNKLVDYFWKLNAVTLAAQLLTTPVSLYHFHQFPNYFLITNFIAVPLSTLILIGEILLCIVSFIKPLALIIGQALTKMIWFLNTHIEKTELLPFSLWESIYLTIPQTFLLLFTIAAMAYWLLEKDRRGLQFGIITFFCLIFLRTISFTKANDSKKLIVYNVPQHKAIDIIEGRKYFFIGDEELRKEGFLRNFHLKPSRIQQRVSASDFHFSGNLIQLGSKKIMLYDQNLTFPKSAIKPSIDFLIISKNPTLYIKNLLKQFNIKQVIADGSVPEWKVKFWKADCDAEKIPFFYTIEKGAYITNIY